MTTQAQFDAYRDAFLTGYKSASILPGHMSAREVSTLHPEYDSDCVALYINGHEDGLRRDSWRYNRMLAKEHPDVLT